MIHKRSKESAITAVMLLVSSAIAAYGIYHATFGAAYRKRTFFDTSGHAITQKPGAWRAILIGSVNDDAALVHALEVGVQQRNQSAAAPIESLVLASDNARDIRAYEARHRSITALAPLAQNLPAAQTLLAFKDLRAQFLLLDPRAEVVFRGSRPRPLDINLVLQRYLPIRENAQPIQVGDALGVTSAVNLATLRPTSVPLGAKLAIVFTGRCTPCALESYLTSARAVQEPLTRYATKHGLAPALVFTSFFNPTKVSQRLAQLRFAMPAYEASADMPGVDYIANHNSVDVLVVETDGSDHVVRLAPLNAYLQTVFEAKD